MFWLEPLASAYPPLLVLCLRGYAFVLPQNLGRQVLLQISTPTKEESATAVASVNQAFDRLGLAPVEAVLA